MFLLLIGIYKNYGPQRTLVRMIYRFTGYDTVCQAIARPSHISPLIKQLTDVRKTSLAMLSAMMLLYVQDNRMTAAGWATATILLTHNLCSMYDSIDEEAFKVHIDRVGPAVFTLLNTFPGYAVTVLLSVELIVKSEFPAIGAVQVVLAFLPGLLQAIAELMLMVCEPATSVPEC